MHLYLSIFTSILFTSISFAQSIEFTFENFEKQCLQFTPVHREGLSEKDLSFAQMVLRETRNATQENPSHFNVSDYWNMSEVFCVLDLPNSAIEIVFQKIMEAEGGCEYFHSLEDRSGLKKKYPELYASYLAECPMEVESPPLSPESYARNHQLNVDLILLLDRINNNDQRYRSTAAHSPSLQKQLDAKNQQLIDSLFSVYKEYPGRKWTGEKYEHVAWAVIQHSNLEMMERYLPYIHQAVQNQQIDETPLKMLIDRVYWLKYDFQLFGSQQGVAIAPIDVYEKVKSMYQIKD